MKALLISMLFVSGLSSATVIELEERTTHSVMGIYEEMREEQQEVSERHDWIHEFEKESVGSEMDHLSALRKSGKIQKD